LPGFTVSGADVNNLDFGLYAQMDFGDLPDSYGTTVGTDGARHVLTTTNPVYLGTAPDADGNAWDSSAATGDDTHGASDENGVARNMNTNWTPGATVSLFVSVTANSGYLVGWFDWNANGVFDASEQVTYGNIGVGSSQTWNVVLPSSYVTGTMVNARFRIYSNASLPAVISPKGVAFNGEVEDYQWLFGPTAITLAKLDAQPVEQTPLLLVLVLAGVTLLTGFVAQHRFKRRAG